MPCTLRPAKLIFSLESCFLFFSTLITHWRSKQVGFRKNVVLRYFSSHRGQLSVGPVVRTHVPSSEHFHLRKHALRGTTVLNDVLCCCVRIYPFFWDLISRLCLFYCNYVHSIFSRCYNLVLDLLQQWRTCKGSNGVKCIVLMLI